MRIALVVEGTRGDVFPMLGLGRILMDSGKVDEILLCAPPDFAADARAHGFAFHAIGPSVRQYLADEADAIAGGGMKAVAASDRYVRQALDWQFDELMEASAGVDRIFAAGVQFSAGSIAEHRGIPYRYVIYCPLLFPSREHPPFVLPVRSMPGWANALAWRVARWVFNLTLLRQVNARRRGLGLAPVRDAIAHYVGRRPILAADARLAPAPRDVAFDVVQIPCLHPADDTPLPPKLGAFLEQGPPPVYVGFGSMTDPDPAATTRAILGAARNLGCRMLVSEGWAGLGGVPLPDDVQTVGAVAHGALFPRMAAVVHHGGAGTTTTAARSGVPQVIVPHLLDQYYWCERVCRLGLGPPPVYRPRLTSDSLAAALGEVLGNEVLAERASELGAELRADAAAPADTAELLAG